MVKESVASEFSYKSFCHRHHLGILLLINTRTGSNLCDLICSLSYTYCIQPHTFGLCSDSVVWLAVVGKLWSFRHARSVAQSKVGGVAWWVEQPAESANNYDDVNINRPRPHAQSYGHCGCWERIWCSPEVPWEFQSVFGAETAWCYLYTPSSRQSKVIARTFQIEVLFFFSQLAGQSLAGDSFYYPTL